MSSNSAIEWTDATWNPLAGCTAVSPGCLNCYAAGIAYRFGSGNNPKAQFVGLATKHNGRPVFTGVVKTLEHKLAEPFGWRKPRRVFVNSMSDLFHEDVPQHFIASVFAVMGLASWHTFQVLTKRAERASAVLNSETFADLVEEKSQEWSEFGDDAAQRYGLVNVHRRLTTDWRAQDHSSLPLRNVWLGVSVEDQPRADERIPHLLKCPAVVRFLSAEPLLGPIDLTNIGLGLGENIDEADGPPQEFTFNALDGTVPEERRIDWIIVGGESGPRARLCDSSWIRSIVKQCRLANVACFVKQWGAKPVTTLGGQPTETGMQTFPVTLKDSKGGDLAELPEDLRVRQMPAVPVGASR